MPRLLCDGLRAALLILPATLVVLWLGASPGRAAPVASWNFNDDPPGVTRDGGPAKLDGVATAVEYVPGPGKEGKALHFARDEAKVDIPSSAQIAFDSSHSFAVSLWVRTTQATGFASVLMAKDRPFGETDYSFCLGRAPGCLSFELWSWGSVKLISQTPVADGEWHYVVGAYDARSNRAYLIVDDRVQAAEKVGRGGPKTVILRLGNNVDSPQPYKGDLDDVVIESGIPADAQKALDLYNSWQFVDAEALKRAQKAYLDRMAAPRFFVAKTAEEWRVRAAQVRQDVLECLGLWPLPERLPLNVHFGGKLQRDGYTLQRLYWQTWPKYYASGWLYMPTAAKLPAPAILCPHGHWENGARNPVVQARCLSLAREGYVVLAVDSVHVYNWSAGLVPLTVMTWNNIRALDLLCSMPEVDPKRLGCTGCSGGAQQTFYLMALEDRLSVAIPVCMVSEWRRILFPDWHHCECNHVPGILWKTDTPEVAACFAPRPSLMICVTKDWTAWLPKEGFPAIKRVWELLGAGDRVQCTQYDWGHDYSLPMREQAYAYFNHWFLGTDDAALAKEAPFKPETLEAMNALDAPPADAAPAESIAADLLKRAGFDASVPGGDVAARLAGVREKFCALTREAETKDAAAASPVGAEEEVNGCRVERLVVTSELEMPVPLVVACAPAKEGAAARRPAVILLAPGGKADLLSARWDLVRALADRGLVVCAPDVRPYGELALNREAQRVNGVVFARPELALAAHDTRRVAQYLRGRDDVDPDRVMVVGYDEAAAVALAAGIYDGRLARIAALGVGDTYSASDRLPRAPKILTVADLPQLAGALAPRTLWLQGPNQPDAFAWTAAAYEKSGAQGSLLVTKPAPEESDLVAWLAAGA